MIRIMDKMIGLSKRYLCNTSASTNLSPQNKLLSHIIFHYQGPHSDFAGPTCGCTACVALIRNNQLVVANAGDSRCVISRAGQVC